MSAKTWVCAVRLRIHRYAIKLGWYYCWLFTPKVYVYVIIYTISVGVSLILPQDVRIDEKRLMEITEFICLYWGSLFSNEPWCRKIKKSYCHVLLNQPENGIELINVIASSQGVVHIKCEFFFKYMGINVP